MADVVVGGPYGNATSKAFTGNGILYPEYNAKIASSTKHFMAEDAVLHINNGTYPIYDFNGGRLPRRGPVVLDSFEEEMAKMIDTFQDTMEWYYFTPDDKRRVYASLFPETQVENPVDVVWSSVVVMPHYTTPMASYLTPRMLTYNETSGVATWGHEGIGFRIEVDFLSTPAGKERLAMYMEQAVRSVWMVVDVGRISALVAAAFIPKLRQFFPVSVAITTTDFVDMASRLFGIFAKGAHGFENANELVRQQRALAGAGEFTMVLVPPGTPSLLAVGTGFRMEADKVGARKALSTIEYGSDSVTTLGGASIVVVDPFNFQNLQGPDFDRSLLESRSMVGEYYVSSNAISDPLASIDPQRGYNTENNRSIQILDYSSSSVLFEKISIRDMITNSQCFKEDGDLNRELLQGLIRNHRVEATARQMEFAIDHHSNDLIDPFISRKGNTELFITDFYGQQMLAYNSLETLKLVSTVDFDTIKRQLGKAHINRIRALLEAMDLCSEKGVSPKTTAGVHPIEAMAAAIMAGLRGVLAEGLTPGNAYGSENLPAVQEVNGNMYFSALIGRDPANPAAGSLVGTNIPLGFSSFGAMFHIYSLGPNANGWADVNPSLIQTIREGVESVRLYARLMEQAYSPNRDQSCNWLLSVDQLDVPFYKALGGGVTEDQRTAIYLQYLLSHVIYPMASRLGGGHVRVHWTRKVITEVKVLASAKRKNIGQTFQMMTGTGHTLNEFAVDPYADQQAEIVNRAYHAYADNGFKPLGWTGTLEHQRELSHQMNIKYQAIGDSGYTPLADVPEGRTGGTILRLFVSRSLWGNSTEDLAVHPTNPQESGLAGWDVADLRAPVPGAASAARHLAARNVARARAEWADGQAGWGAATAAGSRLGRTRATATEERRPFTFMRYGEHLDMSWDTATMGLVQESPDLNTRLEFIFTRILDRMERAHAIAHVFSRITRATCHASVDNNMILTPTLVCQRAFIELRTGAAIYVVPGIGRTYTSRLRTVTAYDSVHKEAHVSLDLHLTNFVKESRRITVIPQAMLLGYLSGGSTAFVPPVYKSDTLDRRSATNRPFDGSRPHDRTGDLIVTMTGDCRFSNILNLVGCNTDIGMHVGEAYEQCFPGALALSVLLNTKVMLPRAEHDMFNNETSFLNFRRMSAANSVCFRGSMRIMRGGEWKQKYHSEGPLKGVHAGCGDALAGHVVFKPECEITC